MSSYAASAEARAAPRLPPREEDFPAGRSSGKTSRGSYGRRSRAGRGPGLDPNSYPASPIRNSHGSCHRRSPRGARWAPLLAAPGSFRSLLRAASDPGSRRREAVTAIRGVRAARADPWERGCVGEAREVAEEERPDARGIRPPVPDGLAVGARTGHGTRAGARGPAGTLRRSPRAATVRAGGWANRSHHGRRRLLRCQPLPACGRPIFASANKRNYQFIGMLGLCFSQTSACISVRSRWHPCGFVAALGSASTSRFSRSS